MHFTDYFAIVERDLDVLNPLTPAKVLELGAACGLAAGQRVLDVGSGKGAVLRAWAGRWGIEGVGVDVNAVSVAAARERAAAEGVAERLTFHEGAALEVDPGAEPYDVGLCLGATFALGGYREAAAWLAARVGPGGAVALGDVFRKDPAAGEDGAGPLSLGAQHDLLRGAGLEPVTILAASDDDWDRYVSASWRAGHDWLRANPGHPDRDEVAAWIARDRAAYLAGERARVGWAILVARRAG